MKYIDIREWMMREGDLCYVVVGRRVTCVRHDYHLSREKIRALLPDNLQNGQIFYGGFNHLLTDELKQLQHKLRAK